MDQFLTELLKQGGAFVLAATILYLHLLTIRGFREDLAAQRIENQKQSVALALVLARLYRNSPPVNGGEDPLGDAVKELRKADPHTQPRSSP